MDCKTKIEYIKPSRKGKGRQKANIKKAVRDIEDKFASEFTAFDWPDMVKFYHSGYIERFTRTIVDESENLSVTIDEHDIDTGGMFMNICIDENLELTVKIERLPSLKMCKLNEWPLEYDIALEYLTENRLTDAKAASKQIDYVIRHFADTHKALKETRKELEQEQSITRKLRRILQYQINAREFLERGADESDDLSDVYL